jgi:hypothetical protein
MRLAICKPPACEVSALHSLQHEHYTCLTIGNVHQNPVGNMPAVLHPMTWLEWQGLRLRTANLPSGIAS